MMTPMIDLPAKADLVAAYEVLRETVSSLEAHAAAPVDGRRLLREGLLSWGRHYCASRAQARSLKPAQGHTLLGWHPGVESPQAAVVSVMATMALHALLYQEARS